MTQTITRELNKGYTNTYGGEIYESDFCTDHPPKRNLASRIAGELKFDKECKRNTEFRNRNKNYKKQH